MKYFPMLRLARGYAQHYIHISTSLYLISGARTAAIAAFYLTIQLYSNIFSFNCVLVQQIQCFPSVFLVQDAVNFTERCALLVEKHCSALKDFTGERPPPIALDIGCAVGGSSFHLTKAGFGDVLGMDYSNAFISAANRLKEHGSAPYRTVIEGEITVCQPTLPLPSAYQLHATLHALG